jgi:uncharacterized flavoprotein (TIGR03862 family)
MASEKIDVLIVGGGPAGLRAAELISARGLKTVLADHKLSVGRKFLVAGRGGLNLTHSEPVEKFPARYGDSAERWQKLLADFSPDDLRAWAKGLGVETFVGTSGRVFPTTKQAAPLLRRWVERLREQGVSFRPRHELAAFRRVENGALEVDFITSQGGITFQTRVLILALGGASWPQTGSEGGWIDLFTQAGIAVTPFAAANCGYEVGWPSEFLATAEGLPLKNIVVMANGESAPGELLVTKYGLEGGALYQLGRALRSMPHPEIALDLKPAFSPARLASKIGHAKGAHLLDEAARAWHLGRAAIALLQLHAPFASAEKLIEKVKAYPIRLRGPRPIAEAISTAGGVSWDDLDDRLMLKGWPGIFCAGEMIDWEAPTGGYLIQGCFSTATCAALGALKFMA